MANDSTASKPRAVAYAPMFRRIFNNMPTGFYKRSNQQKNQLKKQGFKQSNTPWNKGKKGFKLWPDGRTFTEEARRKMRETAIRNGNRPPRNIFYGDKCNFWKDGRTPLVRLIRHSFQYRQWRSDVFTRDNFTCQGCNQRSGDIEAHHIKPFSKIIDEYQPKTLEEALACEELWNINNGITFCEDCHKLTDNYGGKANKKIIH